MKNESNSILTKGISIALVIVFLFTTGYLSGSVTKEAEPVLFSEASADAVQGSPSPVESTTAPTEVTTAAPTISPAVSDVATDTTAEATTAPSTEKTTSEIVQIFNESANRIKGEATKVVKNYEYRKIDMDKLVAPSILQGTAETLIPQFMKDDTDPIEYATAQEIRDNYQVPGQDYVSMLTEADVERATFKDNGSEYEIEIEVRDSENPVAGTGVGSCFDVIETAEVSEAVSFVKNFSTHYFDCVVKCKIDKATGRMTWANYTTPLTLDVTVNLFGTHDASITMSFEKDYVITY